MTAGKGEVALPLDVFHQLLSPGKSLLIRRYILWYPVNRVSEVFLDSVRPQRLLALWPFFIRCNLLSFSLQVKEVENHGEWNSEMVQ